MSTITKYKGTSKVKSEGLILIPKDIRDTMGIAPGDDVIIEFEEGRFIITPLPTQTEVREDNQMQMSL